MKLSIVFLSMVLFSLAAKAETLPQEFDWRDYGVVSEAKNQWKFGTCWAFAVSGVAESKYAIMNNELLEFSEQQLVNCEQDKLGKDPHNSQALEFYEKTGPMLETCASYVGHEESCSEIDFCKEIDFRLNDHYYINPIDISQIKDSIYFDGPAYIGFHEDGSFHDFWYKPSKSGTVYLSKGTLQPDSGHAAIIVGWSDQKQAWLVKNSWGKNGPEENGFFWFSYKNTEQTIMANTQIDRPPLSSINAKEEKNDFLMCSIVSIGNSNFSILNVLALVLKGW